MNRWLDHILIWHGSSLVISDYLITSNIELNVVDSAQTSWIFIMGHFFIEGGGG